MQERDRQRLLVQEYVHEHGGIPEIEDCIQRVQTYVMAGKSYKYSYESKNERLNNWVCSHEDIANLVWDVFIVCLCEESIQIQGLCAMMQSQIRGDNSMIDKVKTIAEVIGLIVQGDLLDIENNTITPAFTLDLDIPKENKHPVIKYRPQTVESNHDPIQGWMLLGNSLNRHHENICLDHVNRANKVKLSLNEKMLREHVEMPTFELDTQEKKNQWGNYYNACLKQYVAILKDYDNGFYLQHKYDTRGRCYAMGYYVNTQGTSYKKSIIQLHKKEKIEC